MFAASWFLPLFIRVLPWSSMLRTIDLLLFAKPVRLSSFGSFKSSLIAESQSSKFVLRVGLSILDVLYDTLMSQEDDLLLTLLHPPADLLAPSSLLPTILTIKIPDRTIRKHTKLAEASIPPGFNDSEYRNAGAR